MPGTQDSERVECVTWNQYRIGLSAVFVGNALFSVILFAAVEKQPTTTTNTNAVIVDSDHDRTALIEKLAREMGDAGLHSGAERSELGTGDEAAALRIVRVVEHGQRRPGSNIFFSPDQLVTSQCFGA